MRKRLITLITIASLAILAVGCGSTDRNANDTTENQNNYYILKLFLNTLIQTKQQKQ